LPPEQMSGREAMNYRSTTTEEHRKTTDNPRIHRTAIWAIPLHKIANGLRFVFDWPVGMLAKMLARISVLTEI